MKEPIVNDVIGLAQKLVRLANWLERNDNTKYWNPWLVRRKFVP